MAPILRGTRTWLRRTYDEGKKIGLRDARAAIAWFNLLERHSAERRAFRESVRRALGKNADRV